MVSNIVIILVIVIIKNKCPAFVGKSTFDKKRADLIKPISSHKEKTRS